MRLFISSNSSFSRGGVLVLGLEILDHRGVFSSIHPVVVVDPDASVVLECLGIPFRHW
jgi:hypothetical protein